MVMRASHVARLQIAAKAAEMRKGVDIRFLDGIFGFAIIPQDAAGDPVNPAIVPLHDSAERGAITGARTQHRRKGRQHAAQASWIIRCNAREKVPVSQHGYAAHQLPALAAMPGSA